MMIERLLFTVIQDGIAYLKANPAEIVKIFGEDALLDNVDRMTEPTKISTLFTARPPSVTQSFPRPEAVFPCYSITLASDTTSQQFLGDDGGFISDPDSDDAGGSIDSEVRAYSYVILVWTQHPDWTLYLYHLLMWMMVQGRRTMMANGIMDIKMSGADVQPDQRTMPAGLFVRRLTFSCDREWAVVPPSSKLPYSAFKVGGVHYDTPQSAGDPGADTGGVVGHVTTPYEDKDDDDSEEDDEGFL